MERFVGQEIKGAAKIAVTANDAIGNFAACTPLLRALRTKYPSATIDYYGGERTSEFEIACLGSASKLFDWRCSVHGRSFATSARESLARIDQVGQYDLVINVESGAINKAITALLSHDALVVGPCLGHDSRGDFAFQSDDRGDLWRDQNWVDANLQQRFPFLKSGFISEIFVRLCYIEPIAGGEWPGGIPRYQFPIADPQVEPPSVILSTGASLASKLWTVENWIAVLEQYRQRGESVGLIGAPPKRQADFYHSSDDESLLVELGLVHDLRGKLTLPEVAGAIAKTREVVTIDNGILHIAAAFDKPTVGLFRPDIVNLWAPPNPNLVRVVGKETVADISSAKVLDAIQKLRLMT